jgi:hypothetical protein
MKKRTRRSRHKHPGLEPSLNLKSRLEEISDLCEYKDQLNDEELNWLNRFSEEYIGANLSHPGKKLHRKAHHKKAIYKKNNARNKCILTREKAKGNITYLEDLKTEERLNNDFENDLIDKIDTEDV